MADQDQPRLAVDALLAGADGAEVTAAEADAEIEIPGASQSGVQAAPGDTTPSVRIAIDKAADMLRQLRGER